jgi:N-methylhydantoinase B
MPSRNVFNPDTAREELASKVTRTITRGAVIRHEQAGGGGYGNPLDRSIDLIQADLTAGKITPGYASRHHGIVFDDATQTIDIQLTIDRRHELQRKAGDHP